MTSLEVNVQNALTRWLSQFELPPLQDSQRNREEAALEMLQNFFLLLLASSEEPLPLTPSQALSRQADSNTNFSKECQALQLLTGLPSGLALSLQIGQPGSPLFKWQEKVLAELPAERRQWLWQWGQLH